MSGENTPANILPKRKIFDKGFAILLAVTFAGGFGVWYSKGAAQVWSLAKSDLYLLLILMPKILAGVFIAGSLPLLFPRDRIAGWIGPKSGLRGILIGAMAGMLIPGGPSVTYLLAAGFMGVGADVGAVIAYVTGWALLNLNRTLIWEMSFLPADVVVLRIALCLPVPVLCGLMARRLTRFLMRRETGARKAMEPGTTKPDGVSGQMPPSDAGSGQRGRETS